MSNTLKHNLRVEPYEYQREGICFGLQHKRIIIGKNGSMLKKIGSYAREDAEALFETKVFLDLWVKVKENWRDRPSFLSDFGFKDELE